MENLIFGAFATLEGYREGDSANLGRGGLRPAAPWWRLCSAKAQNPGCTVALVTNAPPPQPFLGQLKEAGGGSLGLPVHGLPRPGGDELGPGLLQTLRHGLGAGQPGLCPARP